MNKLFTQLQRLYLPTPSQWPALTAGDASHAGTPEQLADSLEDGRYMSFPLQSADGQVRSMVLRFARTQDWHRLTELFQAIQEDLDLPPPAVSVNGQQGYQLWFSLIQPVTAAQAQQFLQALRTRYLQDMPALWIQLSPDVDHDSQWQALCPARHPENGKWSAFIDPSMGGMFMDEPWLEMPPGMDRQAEILSQYQSIKINAFERALASLQTPASTPAPIPENVEHHMTAHFNDPKHFLFAVMNDPHARPELRMEAAKALLPYYHSQKP